MSLKTQVIDLTYLESIADGDNSIIIELVNIFRDQIEEFTEGFKTHFNGKDWKSLAALAHKAKSSVMSMGMTELGEQDLKNLELISKSLQIKKLVNQENRNSKEDEDFESLQMYLNNLNEEKRLWIIKHTDIEVVCSIIDKFNTVCQQAKQDIENYLKNNNL